MNCCQKQGAPSEGHLSLSLQPPYCKFTTRRCFMYRGSLSELVWMGIHQKARSVLHENKPSVSYPRSLSRRPISCSVSSSLPAPLPFFCDQLPLAFSSLFYYIDRFCVVMIKFSMLCLKIEAKSERTVN